MCVCVCVCVCVTKSRSMFSLPTFRFLYDSMYILSIFGYVCCFINLDRHLNVHLIVSIYFRGKKIWHNITTKLNRYV